MATDWLVLVPLTVLIIATVCDLRTREIPDSLSVLLLGWGLTAKLFGWVTLPWLAMGLGLALGLLLTVPFFYFGGLGGGDVKLLTSLGFVAGPVGLLVTLFFMALAGGALALIAAWQKQKDYAYVPAILLGWLGCIGFEMMTGHNIV